MGVWKSKEAAYITQLSRPSVSLERTDCVNANTLSNGEEGPNSATNYAAVTARYDGRQVFKTR